MGSILSSIVSAIVAAILSALRTRRQDEERIDDARQRAKLEVENAALRDVQDAYARADGVADTTRPDAVDRMRDGTF